MYKFETRKDKIKFIRSFAEAAVLLFLLVFILRMLFTTTEYKPYDPKDPRVVSGEDRGFLALSYFGVDRIGTDTLISTKRLNEHLRALSELGYVTITQQDILDYYEKGEPLPDKALFLMFEDGRRDTAIFSEKLLERYNDVATILTYAEKFETKDNKFLMPKDLKNLKESTWWELGTNGYRLSYINAYDRYGTFLGELTSREYSALTPYMGRRYNHYLMDYIRDKDGLPVESTAAMKKRIEGDYRRMEELYTEALGELPGTHVLMHANTGMFGNTERVSQANAENMQRLFPMNFNREGYSLNIRDSSLYDLTRMQPQAYWYTNHLLMRIWDDLDEENKDTVSFVTGDARDAGNWEVLSGAAEFQDEKIILTSVPGGQGLMRLKDSSGWKNIEVSAVLTGNQLGVQNIYMRADDELSGYVSVTFENNVLSVRQRKDGEDIELFSEDLRKRRNKNPISVDEDRRNARIAEFDVRAEYSDSIGEWAVFKKEKRNAEKKAAATVEEGAKEYVPEIQIKDPGRCELRIVLNGGKLLIFADGEEMASLTVQEQEAGSVYLSSQWGGYGYSQRNLADDVYDGVFESMVVCSADDGHERLYANVLDGREKLIKNLSGFWNTLVTWFIEHF